MSLITINAAYRLLRAEANEDGSTITIADEGSFADKPAGAKEVPKTGHGTRANGICIIFAGGAAADKEFNWRLWTWRHSNGPAEHIAHGTGKLGTQKVVTYPDTGLEAAATILFADTLVITDKAFIKPWNIADAGGDNRCGKLWGDLSGYAWIHCEITGADGTGDKAGDVSVYYSYF